MPDLRGGGRSERLRRATRRVFGLVVGREPVLVGLMATMVCLSAFAVWQATRASQRADDTAAQMRVVESQRQVWESRRQTSLNHDVQVLTRYCDTLVAHTAALYQLLGKNPDASGVIPTELELEALSSLSLGGIPQHTCTADSTSADRYEIDRVDAALPSYPGDAAELQSAFRSWQSDELRLMTAGLLFAVALLGLIGIDLLSDRAQRPRRLSARAVRRGQGIGLVIATITFVVGVSLVLLFGDGLQIALVALGLGLVIASRLWRGRRWTALVERVDVPHPHWWAEVLGALTLVAFSASALGLTSVSGKERDYRAESEAQRVVAAGLSEQAQLQASRDLFAVAELAAADAAIAAADLSGQYDGGRAAGERRDEREAFLGRLEKSLSDQFAERAKNSDSRGCPGQPANTSTDARTLMSDVLASPDNLAWHVYGLQEPALECNVIADQTAAAADRWSSRASLFTVALVLLGLSGFLLALAADPSRSGPMANRLLRAGAFGAGLGLVIAVIVPLRAVAGGEGR